MVETSLLKHDYIATSTTR